MTDSIHDSISDSAPLPDSPSSTPFGVPIGEKVLQPGEKIGGFQILEVLGSGGMAVVYKALQLSLNRPVALKILHSRFSRDPAFIQRFEQEAGALAALNHPNIVNVIDKGKVDEVCYFVMEFVQGTSLDRAIIQGTLTPTDYMIIIMGIRDALAYVHSRGIVHRDIKPANILLSDEGRVKVSDFGIAYIAWGDPKLQKSGKNQFGTSYYMAPEQAEKGKPVDARADVYALGVTFYKMFTREIPQGALQGPSQINPRIPDDLDPVILKALQSNPDQRYQSVEEFCNDLLTVLWENSESTGDAAVIPSSASDLTRITPTPVPLGSSPLPIPGQTLPAKPSSTFPSLPKPMAIPPTRPKSPSSVETLPPPVATIPPVVTEKKAPEAKPSKKQKPTRKPKEKAKEKAKEKPREKAAKPESGGMGKPVVLVVVILIVGMIGVGGYLGYSKFMSGKGSSAAAPPSGGGEVVSAPKSEVIPSENPFAPPEEMPGTQATVATVPTPTPVPRGPIEQDLVTIAAGPVHIGDPNSTWASPPYEAMLPAFQIEKYEVTNWMYMQFVKANGYTPPPYWVGGKIPEGRENYPVVEVSLNDAMAYAQWKGRDLPTEEQWERAARGMYGWNYPWGQEWREGATSILTGNVLPVIAPGWRDVTLEPQGEGCHFMAGNVMEWTKSPFQPFPSSASRDSSMNTGAVAVRGGAFAFRTRNRINPIFAARASARFHVSGPAVRFDNLGFRCVVNAP